MRLFDDLRRDDPTPAKYREDSYAFLNRVDQPFWERIRSTLEEWHETTSPDDRHRVRRFRDKRPALHFGAWWELYLHRLFLGLGFDVEADPEFLGGTPDFMIRRVGHEILVEATHISCGLKGSSVPDDQAALLDALNRVPSPHFHVKVGIRRNGHGAPRIRRVVTEVESWLESLDPDSKISPDQTYTDERSFNFSGWELELGAIPIKASKRGTGKNRRLIGIAPGVSGVANDIEPVRRALRNKAHKYKVVDRPYIIGLSVSSITLKDADVEEALFGTEAISISPAGAESDRCVRTRGGLLLDGTTPIRQHISAVLVGSNLNPWSCALDLPKLWINPFAHHPLEIGLKLPTVQINDAGLTTEGLSDVGPREILDLPAEWPGPEAPFQ